MYTFIITQAGSKTSAYVTDMQMYDMEGIKKYISENLKDRHGWRDPVIRVGKVNDEEFGVVSTKNLSLVQFEEIFNPTNNEITDILVYYPNEYSASGKYPIFKKEVYLKYGIAREKKRL